MCSVFTITPPGVHTVITTNWQVVQKLMAHEFADGTNMPGLYFDYWTNDGPKSYRQTPIPDSDDKVYAVDAPIIAEHMYGSQNSYEIHNNFEDYLTWNGVPCSSTNDYWHHEADWKSTQTPPIQPEYLGGGLITLPTTPEY